MRIYDGTICLICLVLKNMVLFTTELDLRRQSLLLRFFTNRKKDCLCIML